MSTSLQVSSGSSTPNFQQILDSALKEYKKKTGKELTTHPLAEEIKDCDSPEAILVVLQGKANELNESQSSDERLTKWLNPTVNVLNALSATLGEGIGTVFPPAKVIFSGISILLVAARDTAASRDALVELFDRIENFFVRLQTYTEGPSTAQMTNVMGKIMADVLSMLAIATKVMKQGRKKTFLKKLVGRNDIEDALQRLDKLELGELRTVTVQVLKTSSDTNDGVKRIEVTVQQIEHDISTRDWERLRGWLTPPDPSTNHNIACNAQHERTAAWVFNEDVFKTWESSGSLLWIHGKPGSGKSILCSAIIQYIITLRDAGSASVAYFYFDFRDAEKKHRLNLLSSLLIQFSSRSDPCLNILSRLYSTHNAGKEQPSEHALVRCLKDMLMAPSLSQLPNYIILDALDECPNTSGIPTPREHVLGLVKDLVDLRLPNLHICVTSRPEVDIRSVLGSLTSGHLSLHDQPGQKRDIATYVDSVVQTDTQMKRWREDDRKLVTEALSEKADGMFRWVFCQLEMLRHCLAPSLRRQLNELPKSLDETYERVLKEIESTNQGRYARRLLQCLAVAMRPLRVEELAEVLVVDLDVAEGEIPKFHAEWRWEDQEQAVLSACSSLISIVDQKHSRVVQFSHFSVKEFLTSDRLAAASGDVSRYHIIPEPAHLILAQACLGVLISTDNRANEENDVGSGKDGDKAIPLLKYAAEHWASHSQVGNVASFLKNGMETLLDLNKPYFLAWRRIHDIDPDAHLHFSRKSEPSPLYYAAFCGFYDLVRRLVVKHPEQVNHRGGTYSSPLVAALSRKHIRVAELLLESGAHVHVRGDPPLLRAITFTDDARVDAVQFLIGHGADVNAGEEGLWSPLHLAANVGCPMVTRTLLEHRADVDLRSDEGWVPLHVVSHSMVGKGDREHSIIARLLVERCADVNARDNDGATPLHFASCHGRLGIARLLLDHGANAHAENIQGRNSLHELSRGVYYPQYLFYNYSISSGGLSEVHPQNVLDIAQLLLEHGVDVNALDEDQATPLHLASSFGKLEIARLLLDRGAKANTENVKGQTPLHLVSQGEAFSHENPDVARLFLELGLDVNARDKDLETPLHSACSHGNFETALVLLDHGAEVNAQNADGQTPLHRVSHSSHYPEHNDPRIAQLLLERGADVNTRDKHQETPLHLASYYKSQAQFVQVLLDHGAEAGAPNADGQTPLHRVSRSIYHLDNNDCHVARLLLERGVDVNTRDKQGATPLHLASSYKADPQIVQVLLDHGAEVDTQNTDGQTMLHLVSQRSDDGSQVARLLLERGVGVNAQDKHRETPLHLASYKWNFRTVQVLLDYGAEADAQNADGQTPLHRVAQGPLHRELEENDSRVARLLLDHGVDVHARDKDQATPLHLASFYGHSHLAEVLLDHRARANAEDIQGHTPLHQVLLGNHDYQSFEMLEMISWDRKHQPGRFVRLAQRLLERGADVNAQNKDQVTPSHLASRLRLLEMARILLKHGANVNVKNSEGKSPLQLASGRRGRAMKRLLSEYSVKQA